MRTLAVLFLSALAFGLAAGEPARARLRSSVETFLGTLSPEQRARAVLPIARAEAWSFLPGRRAGVSLGEMGDESRRAARGLLRSAMSARGYLKAEAIVELENVLRELGGDPGVRDPGAYAIMVYADPSDDRPWGWRFEGHHLSIACVVGQGADVSVTPAFMGANPGEVRRGARAGLRVLAREEDLGRSLVRSLSDAQIAACVLDGPMPGDVILVPGRDAITPEEGLAGRGMSPEQFAMLVELVDEYVGTFAPDLAGTQRTRLGDLRDARFVWRGSIEPNQPHYYRVQGAGVGGGGWAIEYANTQDGANHPHTLFRDLERDFGRDLLREHLERDHAGR